MVRSKHLLLVASTALLVLDWAQPVRAREWPSAGGWDVVEGDDYCAITSEFEGPGDSELYVILQLDGKVIVSLSNNNWTIKEDDALELTFIVNGKAYGGGKALGAPLSGKPGFVTQFEPGFIDDFIKSKSLDVYKGKTVVDNLNLAGSAAGIAQARRCLSHLRIEQQAAAREKARWSHIPEDPFAPPAPAPQHAGGPIPRAPLYTLVSADDYPAVAFANNEQGQVRFKLSVGLDGAVTNCTITETSGSPSLDAATCQLMIRRARFVPARKSDGSPVADTYESSLTWKLN
jgi:TonB family protein